TSTRADYGLLRNLIHEIEACPSLQLCLLVSGTHLMESQGMTIAEIENDGFQAGGRVDIDLGEDTPEGICRSMGLAMEGYGQYFAENAPDLVVVLGDRFETFCCAAAAHISQIPIAHIHGGETTQGAVDEAFRHSITKMSLVHFPCSEEYRRRIIQLGEHPDTAFNVGALGVENIRRLDLMSKSELEKSLSFNLDRPFFLVTFHPVTLESEDAGQQFESLLDALAEFETHQVIFTGANADTGSGAINSLLSAYQKQNPENWLVVTSLGYLRYLSAMKLCDAVVGNSSSGLMEAPVMGVPTVNIGDRQKGRLRVESIIDCTPEKSSIVNALNTALSSAFRNKIKTLTIPFERPGTARNIRRVIQETKLTDGLKKGFIDL
ncbi:MAG: UDP-N-acetylglucosamine 2-epimerase (hydrolyzing), partial [Desulfobacteraceae bacterium]